ncbi:MAG: 3-oxoacyl-ACP synthase [Epulopiscium sp. Nuni2H_MBin003]|nr:MAG: 3-oxoacyl-ACP synthase [Epulopiscium sp. Nuni2H_MBin003]
MIGVKISGVGSAKPKNSVSNDDLSKVVDTSDTWILTRTGIKSRYISDGETTTSLAVRAAKKALADANITADMLDMIIVATLTPDQLMPSAACLVQKELGANNATAFDISAACSGFIFASKIARDAIRTGSNKKVLVIGVEILSKILNWKDRNTCVLFGDGAGAVVYESSAEDNILNIYTGSDGSRGSVLTLDGFPINNCLVEKEPNDYFLKMNGSEVYKFATSIVPICIENVLKGTNIEIQDIDHIVLHQANIRILDTVTTKIGLVKGDLFENLSEYGNTSAASIPIALDEAKVDFKKGEKVLLVGFGGGLTWGSILLEW